jgi:hypothetical protein
MKYGLHMFTANWKICLMLDMWKIFIDIRNSEIQQQKHQKHDEEEDKDDDAIGRCLFVCLFVCFLNVGGSVVHIATKNYFNKL